MEAIGEFMAADKHLGFLIEYDIQEDYLCDIGEHHLRSEDTPNKVPKSQDFPQVNRSIQWTTLPGTVGNLATVF
jgi:hypothetical protein